MIIGIGMDLVEVDRMVKLLERHPDRGRRRLFTAAEVTVCLGARTPGQSFAARFAAKEALFKALGTGWSGGLCWTDIEILKDPSGAPRMELAGKTRDLALGMGVLRTHVTLTHIRDIAGACVILEGQPG